MPPQLQELEKALSDLADMHRELCGLLDRQLAAMKAFDTSLMAGLQRRQEGLHRRILRRERDRRRLAEAVCKLLGLPAGASLTELAGRLPERRVALLEARQALRQVTADAAVRARTCSRVAAGVLGSLNAALHLLIHPDDRAGLYRKGGEPLMPPQRHRLEAVA